MKYIPEHLYYFALFAALSLFYILYGYASLGTNDDWALWGILHAKGIYGTLIMSYPLSYLISHLYDLFPQVQWYSTTLALVIAVNFYVIAHYIATERSILLKVTLLVFALLWLTYLWFNLTVTILTVTTMISAVGLLSRNLLLSFAFVLLASLLRIDIMIITLPYYAVAYFILRTSLRMRKKELLGLLLLLLTVAASLFMQQQDRPYNEWRKFNNARAAIVDMGILDVPKGYFSPEERFCITAGWWQDKALLPTEKVVATTPKFTRILQNNIEKIHLLHFIKTYKFKEWLWLLLAVSLVLMAIHFRNRRVFFIPVFAAGVVLLLITRDVERVTIPMIILWAYILFEALRPYNVLRILFGVLFTWIMLTYESPLLTYRYFKENTALLNEAHRLIAKSGKVCEVSINFPTHPANTLNTLFLANYLFHEPDWMQLGSGEILPRGWLARHPFFYQSHQIATETHPRRKFKDYHAYLVDEGTVFFGSRYLVLDRPFKVYLLKAYDKKYLKSRPECRHRVRLIETSEHFGISQIYIDCNTTRQK